MQISQAQTTTSSLKGIVKGSKNEPIVGANINAIQTSTGTKYSATTNADGRFNILNMRVGGSYKVTVSSIGFQSEIIDDIFVRTW